MIAFGILDFIVPALVPIAVLSAFTLLRRYMPARKPEGAMIPSIESQGVDFRQLGWRVGAAMLCVGAAFAFTSYKCLLLANRYFAEADGPARFQLLPTRAIWWFLPGFGALALAWEITLRLWSFGGNQEVVDLYVQWSNEKTGFDSTRALRWMALVILLPVGIATLLAVPMHTTLRDDGMVIRGYGERSGKYYRYSQARRLATVRGFWERNGKFDPRAEVLVDFSDGYRWHSGDNRDFTNTVDAQLAAFLQQKTALTMEEAETQADLDGSPRR